MEKEGKEEKNMSKKRDLSPDAKIRFGEHLAYDSGYDRLLVFDVSYACESYGICTDFVHVCYI